MKRKDLMKQIEAGNVRAWKIRPHLGNRNRAERRADMVQFRRTRNESIKK